MRAGKQATIECGRDRGNQIMGIRAVTSSGTSTFQAALACPARKPLRLRVNLIDSQAGVFSLRVHARQHEGAWFRPFPRQDSTRKSSHPRLRFFHVCRRSGSGRRSLPISPFAASQSRDRRCTQKRSARRTFIASRHGCARRLVSNPGALRCGNFNGAGFRAAPERSVRLIPKDAGIGLTAAGARNIEQFDLPREVIP